MEATPRRVICQQWLANETNPTLNIIIGDGSSRETNMVARVAVVPSLLTGLQ